MSDFKVRQTTFKGSPKRVFFFFLKARELHEMVMSVFMCVVVHAVSYYICVFLCSNVATLSEKKKGLNCTIPTSGSGTLKWTPFAPLVCIFDLEICIFKALL